MIRQFVMLLVPFIFVATVAEPSPWVQDRFVISMCTDPIVTPDQFDMRWGEIAEANFTVVVSGAWLTPRSARAWTPAERLANAELQMEVAEKHNLSVIMALFATAVAIHAGQHVAKPLGVSIDGRASRVGDVLAARTVSESD